MTAWRQDLHAHLYAVHEVKKRENRAVTEEEEINDRR
jgi:hypothetical protein